MVSHLFKSITGPAFIATAAFLWATDALVRYPAIGRIDPIFIVFVEHVLAVLVLLPWVISKYPGKIFSLSFRDWIAALFSGVGGSALATVFFTASFLYINPSVAILLQKLQPVFVVLIAFVVLGEKPAKKFFYWAGVALVAGIIISFPDLNFRFIFEGINLHSRGIYYSFAAAILWAISTIAGKFMLKDIPVGLAAFWRFFFGLVALGIILILANTIVSWSSLLAMTQTTNLYPLLYLSLVPGLVAMLFYYSGLSRTPASVTAFIELVYPIGAVILNTVFLHTPLGVVQTIAGAVLILAVAKIAF